MTFKNILKFTPNLPHVVFKGIILVKKNCINDSSLSYNLLNKMLFISYKPERFAL